MSNEDIVSYALADRYAPPEGDTALDVLADRYAPPEGDTALDVLDGVRCSPAKATRRRSGSERTLSALV